MPQTHLNKPSQRHHARLPLYTRIRLSGDGFSMVGTTHNIAKGGVGLMLPMAEIQHVGAAMSLRAPCEVALRLPNAPDAELKIAARVAWIGAQSRDPQGRRAMALGLSFEPSQAAAERIVQEFMEGFRYVVAVSGSIDLRVVEETLGELFHIEAFRSVEQLLELRGQLGLVLIGDDSSDARGVGVLQELLSSGDLELQPAIIYFAPIRSAALERVITSSDRVVYQPSVADPLQLKTLAQRCIQGHVMALENERLNQELTSYATHPSRHQAPISSGAPRTRIEGLVGDSPQMRRVYDDLEKVAAHDVSVLIAGETGTGKTIAAHAIHKLSSRASAPFLSQNCAAVAETLLDSELFGHTRGAFTGAVGARPGIFEACHTGTVLLDEIGEMTLGMQAKLLEVLENGNLRRVGESRILKVDVRILCATHRNLQALVAKSQFREDLFYRLGTFVVHLPALRNRREDIPGLARHFLDQAAARFGRQPATITDDAMLVLATQRWPGNIRQLKQTIERLTLIGASGGTIDTAVLHDALTLDRVLHEDTPGGVGSEPLDAAVAAFEKQLIQKALAQADGVIAEAARLLSIERTTLTRRCQRLGIHNP